MRADTYVMFLLGIGLETALLWTAGADRPTPVRVPRTARSLSRRQLAAGTMVLAAVLLVALLRATGVSSHAVRVDDWVGGITFGGVFLMVVVAGVLTDHLLPRVNEQVVLGVHSVVLATEVMARRDRWMAGAAPEAAFVWAGVAAITLVLLAAAAGPRKLTREGHALIYGWFLLVSLFLALQNRDVAATFAAEALSLGDAVTLGGALVFLALHALFLVRFLVIASSLILPRNRPLLQLLVPRLLTDRRLTARQLVVLVVATTVISQLGRLAGFTLPQTPVNLAVMLLVQVDWAALSRVFRRRS